MTSYQNPRKYGSMVFIGCCRMYIINMSPSSKGSDAGMWPAVEGASVLQLEVLALVRLAGVANQSEYRPKRRRSEKGQDLF